MADNKTTKKIKSIGWGILIASFLQMLGGVVITNYGAYIFTDIAGIPYSTASLCMFVVTTLCTVVAFFSGAQVQKTNTKMGQYRPWIMLGSPVILIGGLLMFVKLPNAFLTTTIVCIGYLMANMILNYTYTSEISLQMKMAGENNEARTLFPSRYWAGGNTAMILIGVILVPMIDLLGGGEERRGFMLSHLVLGLLACVGMLIILIISKPYDKKIDASEIVAEENVNFIEMIKGVAKNRPGLMMVLECISRVLAYYVLISLMAYQAEYVIGDMNAMAYFMTASGFLAVIGNFLVPVLVEKIGGRKKVAIISCILSSISFAMISFTGKTLWGFVIPASLGYFFSSFFDTVEPTMFADAGEYYLNKTGKDNRTYMMSMSGLAIKIAVSLSTLVLGAVLGLINYEPGTAMTAASANMLTYATSLVPAACYLLPIVFLVIHGVSDEEMDRCTKENTQKYGESVEY